MANDISDAAIAKIVRDALTPDFDKISDVNVLGRDEDENTLRVQVTFGGSPEDLDARVASSAVRRVRPRLLEVGETAFPLFTFVTIRDAGRLEPA